MVRCVPTSGYAVKQAAARTEQARLLADALLWEGMALRAGEDVDAKNRAHMEWVVREYAGSPHFPVRVIVAT